MQERIERGVGAAIAAYSGSTPVQTLLKKHGCTQHAFYKTLRKRQVPLRSEVDTRSHCELCGDPFTPHHQAPDQKTCGMDCRGEVVREQARLAGSIIECSRCGFEVHHRKAIDARFCSERCKAEETAEEMSAIAKRVALYASAGLSFAEAVRVIGTTEYFAKRACKNYCACGAKFSKGDGRKWCPACSDRRG